MSDKETELVDLNANLSKEEEDIVDSIINELNDGTESKPNTGPPQMSEEDKQKMMHEQQMMQQQRMMQQQQMMQQQRMMQQQQMMKQQQELNNDKKEDKKADKKQDKKEEDKESIIDKLKVDLKDPAIVSIIAFILLMPQSDSIISMTKIEFLLNADGSISIYGYFIKALVAGLLFYLFTKYS